MSMQNMQIESNNLKILKDSMEHEALLHKKYAMYSSQCSDSQIKTLCTEACQIHRNNFNSLKSYLDSHQ